MPKLVEGKFPPASGYDVDIIILTHNHLFETIEAVDSALRQRAVRFYVSVLDQGSDPNIQFKFASAFKDHQNFGYHVIDKNLGVGGGRNFLSSLGSGKLIVALDNDAIFASDLIVARAFKSFDEMPALGALGFKILSRDSIHLDEFSWGYPTRLKKRCDEKFATTTFVGAGNAIRRITWIAAGGYDPDLFFTWEEYDFSLRAIALCWSIIYDGSIAVVHKTSSEARVRWSSDRTKFSVRNRLVIARKWHFSWITLLPRICGYLIKAARNRCLSHASAGVFSAIIQDQSHLKKTMSLRMRANIMHNETVFGENLFQCIFHQVLVKMQPDP